jgi:hypothetical protein
MPFEQFAEIVNQGRARGNSVMRGFAGDPNVAPYIADNYSYLQARGGLGRSWPAGARAERRPGRRTGTATTGLRPSLRMT